MKLPGVDYLVKFYSLAQQSRTNKCHAIAEGSRWRSHFFSCYQCGVKSTLCVLSNSFFIISRLSRVDDPQKKVLHSLDDSHSPGIQTEPNRKTAVRFGLKGWFGLRNSQHFPRIFQVIWEFSNFLPFFRDFPGVFRELSEFFRFFSDFFGFSVNFRYFPEENSRKIWENSWENLENFSGTWIIPGKSYVDILEKSFFNSLIKKNGFKPNQTILSNRSVWISVPLSFL